jgi:hypothetical protein
VDLSQIGFTNEFSSNLKIVLGSNSENLLDVADLTSDIAFCQPPDLAMIGRLTNR